MFVSVVIPMLNAERYLERCLDALVTQGYPASRYEILLVDNGSMDRSVEIAQRYDRVTLLHEPVPGAYSARNRGIRVARGDVIALTDPDCVPDRAWLREIARAMAEPTIALICGRRLPASRSLLVTSLADYETTKDAFVLDGDDEELYYGFSSNMAVRRELFDRLGLFLDRPRGADTLFVRRVAMERTCRAIRFHPGAVVIHLELDALRVYYKKVFLYGRHRRRNNAILRSRPLTYAERLRIFRQTVRRGNYSFVRGAALLCLLGFGSAVWSVGSASARFGPRGLAPEPSPAPHP